MNNPFKKLNTDFFKKTKKNSTPEPKENESTENTILSFNANKKGTNLSTVKSDIYPNNTENHEDVFEKTKEDINGTIYNIKKEESFSFPLYIIESQEGSSYYFSEIKDKSLIVLHYTTGYFRDDIAILTEQGCPLSAPYLIGRNGGVYQLFDPEFWSLHLGRGAKGGNLINSERSIAIELSNVGPLIRENGYLYDIFGYKYCSIEEESFYTKIETPFRKYSYFATFTDNQYESLQELLTYLCNEFKIPYKFLPENKRYRVFSSRTEAQMFEGICTHVNFRAHGKTDIGPGFCWEKLYEK